jgi:hypothetical protein
VDVAQCATVLFASGAIDISTNGTRVAQCARAHSIAGKRSIAVNQGKH